MTWENARFLLMLLARTVMSTLAIVKVIGLLNYRFLVFVKDFHPPCLMGKFFSGKVHFLVDVYYKSFIFDVCYRFKYLILELLLHFGNIAHILLCKSLKLYNVYVCPVYCQSGIFGQLRLFK